MFLGDSMGAAAALRFPSVAKAVLAFTPQIDISTYEAITRSDFPRAVKEGFGRDVIEVLTTRCGDDTAGREGDKWAQVHYGVKCEEDVRQVGLLPRNTGVELVSHDYDDHILSLFLRKEGVLTDLVERAVQRFFNGSIVIKD
mmetsp:Transcript_55608/g.66862  ORF Transcript_55608/g.66862 Transcript_55608/m.66862 type:complete len:142 (-) Transcript_55608:236-661(-)